MRQPQARYTESRAFTGTVILPIANIRRKTLRSVRSGLDSRFRRLWMAVCGRERLFLLHGMIGADGTTMLFPPMLNNGTASGRSIQGMRTRSLMDSSFAMAPAFLVLSSVHTRGRDLSRPRNSHILACLNSAKPCLAFNPSIRGSIQPMICPIVLIRRKYRSHHRTFCHQPRWAPEVEELRYRYLGNRCHRNHRRNHVGHIGNRVWFPGGV